MQTTPLEEVRAQPPPDDPEAYAEATLAFDLASLVYRLRTAAGITKAELARRMGTSRSAIARLESGGTVPTFELLDRLGKAVGVTIGDVSSDVDEGAS